MIGYEEARKLLLREARPLPGEQVPLLQGGGRILLDDLASPTALPRFDNAAMDGFALATGGAVLPAGLQLPISGCGVAGVAAADAVAAGAWEIMTGAPVPARYDTVVPVERVQRLAAGDAGADAAIRLLVDAAAGSHIRRRGEDVAEGAAVLAAGSHLQAQQLMLLAALGQAEVAVVRRPRVAIIATGRELARAGDAVPAAHIHDSNSPYLRLRLAEAGAEVVSCVQVADEPALFQAALQQVLELGVDMVLSTGAVSQGRHDFVPAALRERGARIGFHGVAIRPGKPLLYARLGEGPHFLGLPGNPVSCAVGLRFFVEPLLRAMLGLAEERPARVPLAAPCWKRQGLRAHFHARWTRDGEGGPRIETLPRQESFRLLPFLSSQAWVVLPETIEQAQAGEPVEVYGLGHLQPLTGWPPG